MNAIINKMMLLALCISIYCQQQNGPYAVVPLLAAITASALCEIVRKDGAKAGVVAVFAVAGAFYFPLLYFLPLTSYDAWDARPRWSLALLVLPFAIHFAESQPVMLAIVLIYTALSAIMKWQAQRLGRQRRENNLLRDDTKELLTGLTAKNRELLEKQEYEVNLATLEERNRIAREMHDTVGHLLSSSILQIGALLAVTPESPQREGLMRLKDTLSQGMDSVRSAIHNLHDEAFDLFAELTKLCDRFTFCAMTLDYDVEEDPNRQVKYAFTLIVKESLSNVAKHSNASRVEVAVHEHPAFYQLVVRDNGTKGHETGMPFRDDSYSEGMGLKNIRERVETLGGYLNIRRGFEAGKGFEVFVSVAKDGPPEEKRLGKGDRV